MSCERFIIVNFNFNVTMTRTKKYTQCVNSARLWCRALQRKGHLDSGNSRCCYIVPKGWPQNKLAAKFIAVTGKSLTAKCDIY
jgi:hypothetical protein